MSEQEEWRPVVGWEGLYEVSSLGRVKACAKLRVGLGRGGTPIARAFSERMLRLRLGTEGYEHVVLQHQGRAQPSRVHTLACEAFNGPQPFGHEVAHNNGIRSDNRASNLRWASHRDNAADRLSHGTLPWGEGHAQAKLSEADVRLIRLRAIDTAAVKQLALHFGVSKNTIYRIRRRAIWRHLED